MHERSHALANTRCTCTASSSGILQTNQRVLTPCSGDRCRAACQHQYPEYPNHACRTSDSWRHISVDVVTSHPCKLMCKRWSIQVVVVRLNDRISTRCYSIPLFSSLYFQTCRYEPEKIEHKNNNVPLSWKARFVYRLLTPTTFDWRFEALKVDCVQAESSIEFQWVKADFYNVAAEYKLLSVEQLF